MNAAKQQQCHSTPQHGVDWDNAEDQVGQLLDDAPIKGGATEFVEDSVEIINDKKDPSPTAHLEDEVRTLRKASTADAAMRLEQHLNDMKQATKKMLNEIDVYLKESETIMIDYIGCQYSQQNEAVRLEECEPGVTDATQRFLQNMASGQWQ